MSSPRWREAVTRFRKVPFSSRICLASSKICRNRWCPAGSPSARSARTISARRVAVHRAVWHPSRVTEASYRNVMTAWPYRGRLDWVVEAPDGRFAAQCLVWLDEHNAVGELEPVGTLPEFRRRGLARTVCLAALHAARDAGARKAVVYPVIGDPKFPAASRCIAISASALMRAPSPTPGPTGVSLLPRGPRPRRAHTNERSGRDARPVRFGAGFGAVVHIGIDLWTTRWISLARPGIVDTGR
jgi:GNAT superfamily N-acetyltransferase